MSACPEELELDRAIHVGFDGPIALHVDSCAACQTFVDETREAIALARDLPVTLPPAAHLEERRTVLLAAWDPVVAPPAATAPVAKGRAPLRLRWVAALAACAALAAGAVLALRTTDAPPKVAVGHPVRGTVHAHAGAAFTRAAAPPDEIVRLRDGTIDVDVDPLAPGERFRIVIGADQIEVRGTSFEVVAAADRLLAVRVVHGRVEVSHAGAPPIFLVGGDAWRAPAASSVPPPAAVPPLPPARSPALRPAPRQRDPQRVVGAGNLEATPAAADPQELAFNAGWEAMRLGGYGQAAAAFSRAIALAPDGALTEDATYWHAVAVARLKRTGEAIIAFRSFLDAFPESTRAGEASAMLGWLLVDTREIDEARRRFQAAANDPNLSARESARKGLESIR